MIKKNLKFIIPIAILIFGISLFLILFYNIPRLSYKYIKDEDAYYVDNAYGNASKYVIPQTYKDKPIIGIDERAFFKHSNLKEIVLSSSVEVIERLAFSECHNLEAINLENVKTIYRNAFSYCDSLNNIVITANDIGASAFYKCENLTDVSLNDGIVSIGSMAFAETKISNIFIPRSVISLEVDCFYGCYALKNINVYGDNLKNNKYLSGLNIVNYIS